MIGRLIGILLIVAAVAGGWQYLKYQEFTRQPLRLPDSGLSLTVEPGMSLGQLAHRLKERGVIDNPLFFKLLARQQRQASRIKAGEYHVIAGVTPVQLLDQLVAGKVMNYAFTIIEGWRFSELLDHLAADSIVTHKLTGGDEKTIMRRLGYPDEHPEGRFLPETYYFPRGLGDIALLKRAHDEMARFLAQAWEERDENLPYKTPYEALIMASIVEKETGKAAERPRIAGVFVRRLRKGMLLQTDPTVIYGMGDRYKGNIRRGDLRRDTPYNTYTRRGLPPTPICLPGKDAILAALHPADGKSLYFVARGDGSHQFSATLKQHNRAVRKYQLKRR